MIKSVFSKNALTYVGIVISFLAISYLFMSPLLEGKRLQAYDLRQHIGMAKETNDFRNETGDEALWTNSMFCGMPAYLISTVYPGNFLGHVRAIFVDNFYPAGIIFLYLLGFFILLSSLKINKWLSFIGALAFAFSSYFIIIIEAGHATKAYAIGFLPIVVAGVIATYNKKYIPGFIIYTIGLIFEIQATHYQITYYGIILLLIYVIVEFVFSLKEKQTSVFAKSTLFLIAGTILAVGANSAKLYTTYEYSKETIRSPSELTIKTENQEAGLDKSYLVKWSQGIDETLTLLIPNFKGGSSYIKPGPESESYKLMRKNRLPDINKGLSQINLYHGEKPGTSGPFYVGAIIMFLFVLGLFILKGKMKWWLLSSVIVAIVMSWGKNVMGLTSFLIDYLPLFSTFRAPDMILIIVELAIPLLSILVLNKIITGDYEKSTLLKSLKLSFLITGGITLLFALVPGIFDNFSAPTDFNQAGKQLYPDWLMPGIISDRKQLLRADAFRSFILISLSAGVLFAIINQKIKSMVALTLLGLLIIGDLWFIDKRYLNENNFGQPGQGRKSFSANVADASILVDKDINYRVLPINNPFNDTHYSYHHKNVLGYHAAKLRRPHEIMDNYLAQEMEALLKIFVEQVTPTTVPPNFRLINMLNSRYIVYSDNLPAIRNPYSMGNAWFVNNIKMVENADEELNAIKDFDPRTTTLVDKRFAHLVSSEKYPGKGTINLTDYKPNYLKYDYQASEKELVVFSEVYYDKGWNAFIDNVKVPYLRANYMLRALEIPAGKHVIEFKFRPKSYYLGNKVSFASSLLVMLAVAAYALIEIRKKPKNEAAAKK